MDVLSGFSVIHPNAMLVFGLFLLFGVLGGMIATRLKWMPTITAFMLLGFIAGPYGLGLITQQVLAESAVFIDIALGLILYKLGNMLHPREMMHSKRLLMTTAAETGLTFFLVSCLMIVLNYDLAISVLVGAIAVSSSPAVLVHVSEEMRAKGPVTEHAKSLVAMNNLISFVIFSLALPFILVKQDISMTTVLVLPLYRMLGAVLIGIAIGWMALRITRLLHKFDQHYRFVIIIGAVMVTLGLCQMFGMSSLLGPLVLGISTRWFETSKHNLSRIGLGEGGDLFYIILFVMSGAKISPSLILAAGIVPVLLVLTRSIGKMTGVIAASRFNNFDKTQVFSTSLLLLPMAGMAIGLVATTYRLVPDMSEQLATIIFSMVVIFETIGPFMASYALRACGEADKETQGEVES